MRLPLGKYSTGVWVGVGGGKVAAHTPPSDRAIIY